MISSVSFDQFLVTAHFLGLTLGFASGFGNMVMAGLIAKAASHEKPVLERFPPAIGRLGVTGLVLLWGSGLAIVYTRYGTFSILPRTFVIKLAAVVLLTLTVAYINLLQPRAQAGDAAANARIQLLGRISGPLSLVALIFAVLTFD
jgi:hypothetical protein